MRSLGATGLLVLVLPAVATAASPAGFVSQGSLLVNREGNVVKVPLKHTEVRIQVTGQLAEATVKQTFENPYPDKIEAIYVFPLPTSSAIWDFALESGDRVIRGRIMQRAQARAIYRRATLAGQVAALLTQERPNLFTQKVANLEPGKSVQVTLRYVSQLRYDAGSYELVFPMVVGPRFVPRKKGAHGRPQLLSPPVLPPQMRSAHDIDLALEIEAGVPVDKIGSTSHQIRTRRRSPSAASVVIDEADSIPNRDFVLRYKVAGRRPRAALVAHRAAEDKPGALLLMVQPPEAGRLSPVPRELIFVLDASSSMNGAPLRTAKTLVRHFLKRLGPQDTFQIVRFADNASSLGPKMIANRSSNRKLALAWLDRVRAAGGTQMASGIGDALALPHDPARQRQVIFVSDGYIGNEDEVLQLTRERLGKARIFALGVGSAVNRYLLEEMALAGRGLVRVVRPDEPADKIADELHRRISRPLLTDITVELRGLKVSDLSPRRLPDLFAGQPLLLHGRYTAAGSGSVVLRGQRQGVPVKIELPVTLPRRQQAHRAVSLAWARATIADLERRLIRSDDEQTRRRIIELALEHGLLTRFTAFVAVDEDSSTSGDSLVKVRVPVDRPQFVGGSGARPRVMGAFRARPSARTDDLMEAAISRPAAVHRPVQRVPVADLPEPRRVGSVPHARPAVRGRLPASRAVLDRDLLRRVIRGHLARVNGCYRRALDKDPTLAGRVNVRITVDAGGRVSEARVSSTTLNNLAVERCVVEEVRRFTFPGLTRTVVVQYPFSFQPSRPVPPRR